MYIYIYIYICMYVYIYIYIYMITHMYVARSERELAKHRGLLSQRRTRSNALSCKLLSFLILSYLYLDLTCIFLYYVSTYLLCLLSYLILFLSRLNISTSTLSFFLMSLVLILFLPRRRDANPQWYNIAD